MPATFTTREQFPINTNEVRLQEEIRLRIAAGAIRSWIEKKADEITLLTEWNVFGEQ